jgi:Ca2+-binding RTX toxin-like protein
LITAVALATASASAAQRQQFAPQDTVGPYTGVGTGLVDRYHHLDDLNPGSEDHFYSDSKDVYKVRFTYSFRIRNGIVEGRGTGVYLSATWHLSGRNGKEGGFDCDIPVHTTNFAVQVSGHASGASAQLRFELVGARETNAEYNCGANYKGFATDSTYAANSLDLVQANGITVDRLYPRIAPLRKLEELGDQRDKRVNLHEWEISIAAPPNVEPPPGRSGSAGGYGSGKKPSAQCTISGTPGNDTLVGTPGNDVICGFGGNDTIRGLGGLDTIDGGLGNDVLDGGASHDTLIGSLGRDILRGGPGRDLLLARDRTRDAVSGGPQRDRARVDKRSDRVSGVESVS